MGGCDCCHGWCRGSCVLAVYVCALWCVAGTPDSSGAGWGQLCTLWWAPGMWAPGGLLLLGSCRGIMWWGSSSRGEGCAACAQPLPALLTASSAVPLAMCCPAFCASALIDVLSKSTLNYGNNTVVNLPDAFSVLQLAGMAGELWASHLLGLVGKAARLPKAKVMTILWLDEKTKYTTFSC